MPSREEQSEPTASSKEEATTVTILERSAETEPITANSSYQEPKAHKSDRSWWRRGGECPDPPPESATTSKQATTPTSPLLSAEEFQENIRFDFVLKPSRKRLTLNDVFITSKSIIWKENKKFTTADLYRDTITVSWDQSKESLRKPPKWPHLQKEKENHPHSSPSNSEKVITMEFIGKREVPQTVDNPPKKSEVNQHSLEQFRPRKDAAEFHPSFMTSVQSSGIANKSNKFGPESTHSPDRNFDYPPQKTQMNYVDEYPPKRPVKADSHHLPTSSSYSDKYPEKYSDRYSDKYSDKLYSDYPDYPPPRESEYSSSRSLSSRQMHHDRPGDMYDHYPHTGYSEAHHPHRGDPAREHYSRRRYEADADPRRAYYEKYERERMRYRAREYREARDRYEMSERKDYHKMRHDHGMPSRDEYSRESHSSHGAYSSSRDSLYPRRSHPQERGEEFERVLLERQRQRYLNEMRRHGRGSRSHYYQDEYVSPRSRHDSRMHLYYRMKQEEMYNEKVRRRQGGGYSSYGQTSY